MLFPQGKISSATPFRRSTHKCHGTGSGWVHVPRDTNPAADKPGAATTADSPALSQSLRQTQAPDVPSAFTQKANAALSLRPLVRKK